MTDKERLNTILRLRLFYSTEKELGDKVGLSLKGNHFSKQKPFACEAFFSKFSDECRKYTQDVVNLALLINQYETTSKFFKKYIEKTGYEENKRFIPYLLNYIFMGETPDDGTKHLKNVIICERYDAYNIEGEMNVGILILMTYGLIPTFKNKTCQDVADIIKDFKITYNILLDIAQAHQSSASTKYKEMLCLKEMRKLIEEEVEGDNYLNRLLLIHITNDVLNRVFALKKPAKLKEFSQEVIPMNFNLPRLWRCDEEPENVVWEFVPVNMNAYFLYRNEIDFKGKKVRFTRYQLTFKDMGYKDFCYTIIMRPSFNWHNILKREQPEDSQSFDYTDVEYEVDKCTVKQLIFTQESPICEKPMTLKAVKKPNLLDYYAQYLDHQGVASNYEDEDDQPQYAIAFDSLEVAVTNTALIIKGDDGIYKLEKFDEDGNETISGITSLTHSDNFVYAEIDEDGTDRQFICLDSINQNLDLIELLKSPYFNKMKNLDELF